MRFAPDRNLQLALTAAVAMMAAGCGGGGSTTVIERTVTVQKQPTTPTTSAGAGQTVELGSGIGPVAVGMSTDAVRAALGRPSRTEQDRHPIAGPVTRYVYDSGLSVSFAAGSAFAVSSTSPQARTSSGVGVGSSGDDVRGLPGFADCRNPAGEEEECTVGQARPGQVVTLFNVVGGRVMRVTISRIID